VSCYEFLSKNSPPISVCRRVLGVYYKLFLLMCAIFENVWHHKLPSVFHVSRVFIALINGILIPWPPSRRIQDFQLATRRITPQCEIIISRRRDIASRPSRPIYFSVFEPMTYGSESECAIPTTPQRPTRRVDRPPHWLWMTRTVNQLTHYMTDKGVFQTVGRANILFAPAINAMTRGNLAQAT